MPTTFTVFFNDPDSGHLPAPQLIRDMTDNIRRNGYSSSNQYSDVWAIKTDHNTLLNLITDNVLKTVRSITSGVPTGMTLIDSTIRYSSLVFNSQDSSFIFAQRFALDPGTTPFRLEIKYLTTDLQTMKPKDTVTVVQFAIRRQGTTIPPADRDNVEVVCWNDMGIELYYRGQRVTEVKQYMDTLEVRLSTGDIPVSQARVTIANSSSPIDSLALTLTNRGTYWSGFFRRETGSQANTSDTRLQHRHQDSIIVVYRHPSSPQRLSRPFIESNLVTATDAFYFDRNADGLIDSISISLQGQFTAADIPELTKLISLPPQRRFIILGSELIPGGIGLIVREGAQEPNTGVTPADQIIIGAGPLAPGNWMVDAQVQVKDRAAPVILRARIKAGDEDSLNLEVVFSETVREINRDEPFLFRSPQGESYSVKLRRLSQDGSMVTFRILQVSPAETVPQVGDSIWINPTATVGDAANNNQQNPANRRVLLTAENRPFEVKPYLINNPLMSGRAPVPKPIRDLPGIKTDPQGGGLVVVVEPKSTFVQGSQISATISIYDVVKNPIITDQTLVPGPNNRKFFFVWDGTNSNGRRVGTGTYLAVIRVSNGQGSTQKINLRLGVRR